MKFGVFHLNLRKQPFLAIICKTQGERPPLPTPMSVVSSPPWWPTSAVLELRRNADPESSISPAQQSTQTASQYGDDVAEASDVIIQRLWCPCWAFHWWICLGESWLWFYLIRKSGNMKKWENRAKCWKTTRFWHKNFKFCFYQILCWKRYFLKPWNTNAAFLLHEL